MQESQLATYLGELGWSPELFSRKLNSYCGRKVSGATTPYAWLSGRIPRGQLPFQIADLLSEHCGVPVDASTLWPEIMRQRIHTPSVIFTAPWTEGGMHAALHEILRYSKPGRSYSMPTPHVTKQLVESYWSAPALTPSPSKDGLPCCKEIVPLLAKTEANLRAFHNLSGGIRSLVLAEHELALAARLITAGRYDSTTGAALYRAFADLTTRAGYIAMDSGLRGTAHAYWVAGLRAARLASAPSTASHLLSAMSLDSTIAGDHELGRYLAESAGRAVRHAPVTILQVVATAHNAFALATAREDSAARRSLDEANQLSAEQDRTATPPCARNITPGTVDRMSGYSLLRLNHIDEASVYLERFLQSDEASQLPLVAAVHAFLLGGIHLARREEAEAASFTHRGIELGKNLESHLVTKMAMRLLRKLDSGRVSAERRDAVDHLKLYVSSAHHGA